MLHFVCLRFFVYIILCYCLLLCVICDDVQDSSKSIGDKKHPKIVNPISNSKIENPDGHSNIEAPKLNYEKEKSNPTPDQSPELARPRPELEIQPPYSHDKPSQTATINKDQDESKDNETFNVDPSIPQTSAGGKDSLETTPVPVSNIPVSEQVPVNTVPSESPNVKPKLKDNPYAVEEPGRQISEQNIEDADVKKPENVKPSLFNMGLKNVGSLLKKGMKNLGIGKVEPHIQPSPDLSANSVLPEDFENSTLNEYETIPSNNERNDAKNEHAPIPNESNFQEGTPSNSAHASENDRKEAKIEISPENNSVKPIIDDAPINQSDINNDSFRSSGKTNDLADSHSEKKLASAPKNVPVSEEGSDVKPSIATTQNATFHSTSEIKGAETSNSHETLKPSNSTKPLGNISNQSIENITVGASSQSITSDGNLKLENVRETLELNQVNMAPFESPEKEQPNVEITNALPEHKSLANISNNEHVANSNGAGPQVMKSSVDISSDGAAKNIEANHIPKKLPQVNEPKVQPQVNEPKVQSTKEDVPSSSIESNSPPTATSNENISKSRSADVKSVELDLNLRSDNTDVGAKPVYEMDSESPLVDNEPRNIVTPDLSLNPNSSASSSHSENIDNLRAIENSKLDDNLKSDKGIVEDSSSSDFKSYDSFSEMMEIVSESNELPKREPGSEERLTMNSSYTVAQNIPSKPFDEKDSNSDVTSATNTEEKLFTEGENANIAASSPTNADFANSKIDVYNEPINNKPISSQKSFHKTEDDSSEKLVLEQISNKPISSQESFHKAESDSSEKLVLEQISNKPISSQESFHKAESDSSEKLVLEQISNKPISSQESFHKAESDSSEKLVLEQINNEPISSQESFHKYESDSAEKLIVSDETNQSSNFISEPTANVSLLRGMYGIIEVGIRMGLNLSSQILGLTDSYKNKSNKTCVNGDCENLLFSGNNTDINPLRFWVIVCTLFCILVPSFWFFIFNNSSEMRKKISVSKINELEKRLFDSTTQIKLLKSKVRDGTSNECGDYEIEFIELKSELDSFRVENAQFRNKINFLEGELQNRTRVESEENKERISELEREIDKLKTAHASNEKEFSDLRNKLEFEKLIIQKECDEDRNSLQKFEVENHLLRKQEADLRDKNQTLVSQLDNRNKSLVQLQSKYADELIQIKCKAQETALSLHKAERENRELVCEYDKIITSMKSGNISKDIRELVSLRANATSLEDINSKLKSLLKEEKSKCAELQETIIKLNAGMSEVTRARDEAKKDYQELEDKITFFKELLKKKKKKHNDIKKQLENFKKNDPLGICGGDEQLSKRFSSLCNEVDSYKLQVERLQKEITDQEVDYKAKILNLEQKKHEYWLGWRNVERKYKNSEQEAANLRNKILALESDSASYNNLEKLNSHDNSNEVSMSLGDGSSIPSPVPFSPPPPLPYYSSSEFNAAPPLSDGFIPPPPLHEAFYPPEPIYMLSSDERLPPVGSRHDSNYYPNRGGEALLNGFPSKPLDLYPETPLPSRKSHRYNGYNNRRTNRAGSSSSKSTESLSHHSTRNWN